MATSYLNILSVTKLICLCYQSFVLTFLVDPPRLMFIVHLIFKNS